MRPPAPAAIKTAEEFAGYFSVSRETLARLETYEGLLRKWQQTINLVASSTLADVWGRHFADSAQLLELAPAGAKRWVDLGAGAGFPGLVIAILLSGRSGADAARVRLVESDSRKAAFLREVARTVGVPVDILCERIEKAATQAKLESIDVVSARALAPLPRLLDLSAPYFSKDTVGLFLKGREAQAEVEAAHQVWDFTAELAPSVTDRNGRIVVVRGLNAKTEVHSR